MDDMRKLIRILVLIAAAYASTSALAATNKPSTVLVRKAFAGSDIWDGVIKIMEKDGYAKAVAANPILSVTSDAESWPI